MIVNRLTILFIEIAISESRGREKGRGERERHTHTHTQRGTEREREGERGGGGVELPSLYCITYTLYSTRGENGQQNESEIPVHLDTFTHSCAYF